MEKPLPPGWEAKVDRATNRVFYVDHINKVTIFEGRRGGCLHMLKLSDMGTWQTDQKKNLP